MKIAVVGKGGSGKSTVSYLLSKHFAGKGKKVLAIDADYNMDLAHNLGREESQGWNFLNKSGNDFYEYLGLETQKIGPYIGTKDFKKFSFYPQDSFTEKYTKPISENIHLMITGAFHEEMLYGDKCNHSFIKPLKLYIPLLEKSEKDVLIVDSVAGTDMVSFGLYLGVDLLCIVVENNRNSVGVAKQLVSLAEEYGLPYRLIVNKAKPGDYEILADIFSDKLIGAIPAHIALAQLELKDIHKEIYDHLYAIEKNLLSISFDPLEQMDRHNRRKEKHENYGVSNNLL